MFAKDFNRDDFKVSFEMEDEMSFFLDELVSEDKWRIIPTKSLRTESMTNAPLCVPDVIAENPTWEEDAIRDTMEKAQRTISYSDEYVRKKEMIRECAFPGLLRRAKIYGSALNKVEPHVLSEILNEALDVWGDNALLLVRGGKVSGIHSGDSKDYQVIKQDGLFKALQTHMDGMDGTFIEGYYGHELTMARYVLPKGTTLDRYEDQLSRHGFTGDDYFPEVVFSTSDVGISAVTLSARLVSAKSSIPVGSPLKVKHIGTHSEADFTANLGMLYALLQDACDKLVELMDVAIANPIACAERILEKSRIPEKAILNAINNALSDGTLYAGCSAYQIYICMAEALSRELSVNPEKYSSVKCFEHEENLARLLSEPWEEYDYVSSSVT
jgi:hypothetical protein